MPNNIDHNILERDIDVDDLGLLEDWGRYLAPDPNDNKIPMTSTQIRKFFGEMKRIQAGFSNLNSEIILLDPKIAYAVGRAKKEGKHKQYKIEEFYKLVSPLLKKIKQNEIRYKRFVKIIEAIVAYHKAYGGS